MKCSLIANESSLAQVAADLQAQTRIALDCEAAGFHRYTDRLCLVQLSTATETYLFDPLSCDPSAVLKGILEDPGVQVVMHGADFDLRLLDRDLDIRLQGLFDTQAAATLLGASSIGLASLLEEHLDVKLSKAHQRADWAQRPLPQEMLEYAASDTEFLLELGTILANKLSEVEREGWAKEEFEYLETIRWEEETTDPVVRFKGARHLTPRQVTALREVLSWRDDLARSRDKAPFRIVGDPVLAAVVMERPETVDGLAALKGMSPRLARSHGRELLTRLEAVDALPEEELIPFPKGGRNGPGRPTPEEEALADRIRALRAGRAEGLGLDKGVLLSNAQILEIVRSLPRSEDALNGIPGIRGWQAKLLGAEILEILAG
jgi:ribonuclease D